MQDSTQNLLCISEGHLQPFNIETLYTLQGTFRSSLQPFAALRVRSLNELMMSGQQVVPGRRQKIKEIASRNQHCPSNGG